MANSVDELKALANTKLGFARANRFLVTFPTSFGGSGGLLLGGSQSQWFHQGRLKAIRSQKTRILA